LFAKFFGSWPLLLELVVDKITNDKIKKKTLKKTFMMSKHIVSGARLLTQKWTLDVALPKFAAMNFSCLFFMIVTVSTFLARVIQGASY
jgi:hypothetical protein